MSDELIKELRGRITELQQENRALKDETIDRRGKLSEAKKARADYEKRIADLTAERDTAAADLKTLTAERDELKQKIEATPGELAVKVQDLESQIRERDHRDAWRDALDGQLQDKADVRDVWAKAGYKAEGDTPSAETIKELAGKARDAAPYLFRGTGETPAAAPGGANVGVGPPLKVGETPGRGARDGATGQVRYSKEELARPGWETRRPELKAALADGTAVLV